MERPTLNRIPSLASNSILGRWLLPAANYTILIIGSLSSSLLARFYFMHGGSSLWVSIFVQSAGFPLLLLLPLCRLRLPSLDRRLLLLSVIVGLLLGLNNFLFSLGISYLPVSTSSLLLSSQLAFNLILSIFLVGQKLRFTNLNCVVLLTLSSILLALGSSHDRPAGVTNHQFFIGYLATLGAGILFATYLPVMEMIYGSVHEYRTVVEIQLVMEAAATVFATTGMVAYGGFAEMKREGEEVFDLGKGWYWATIGTTVVAWQLVFMGTSGMVFFTSSLNSGICTTAGLTLNVIAGVLLFGDQFGGQKAVATVLCIWGFASYLFGEYSRKKVKMMDRVNGDAGGDELSIVSDLIDGENGEG